MDEQYRDHPNQIYPWRKWFDGNEHRLVRGVDFTISIPSFCNHARQKAANHRKDLKMWMEGDVVCFKAAPW